MSAPEKSLPSTATRCRWRRLRLAAVNDEPTMRESSTCNPSKSSSEKSPGTAEGLVSDFG